MPVYLVCWPNLDLALVQARDEDDLIDKLDEVDDPSSASWSVYRGLLYLGLTSPVTVHMAREAEDDTPLGESKVPLDGLEAAVEDRWQFALEPCDSDSASEMPRRILDKALPAVAAALNDEAVTAERLGEAVLEELAPLFAYHWRQAQLEQKQDSEVRDPAPARVDGVHAGDAGGDPAGGGGQRARAGLRPGEAGGGAGGGAAADDPGTARSRGPGKRRR